MFRRRVEYLFLALAAVIACVTVIFFYIQTLPSSLPINLSDERCGEIVNRAGALISSDEATCAKARLSVGDGMYSVGDYLISVFTSPEYLLMGRDDSVFAQDLANVLDGEASAEDVGDITSDLSSMTRMAVINKYARKQNRGYAVTGKIESGAGSVVSDINLTSTLSSDGYTIGIKQANGSFTTTGDEVRTDFFIDNNLSRGYLSYGDIDQASGSRDFSLSWNSAGALAGTHNVSILIRSSDGRGVTVDGGSVNIPESFKISNGSVANGSITAGSDSTWYMLDCNDSDCYVNFVDIGDDLEVSLYDVCGNLIGTNSHEGSEYETLRSRAQDVAGVEQKTGISDISNMFYVEVRRASTVSQPDGDVYYKMVQSREVAYYDGSYMAVTRESGSDKLKLLDLNRNSYEVAENEVSLLPLNGTLSSLKVRNSDNGQDLGIFPVFDIETHNYAFYMPESRNVTVNCDALEGYSASVAITASAGPVSAPASADSAATGAAAATPLAAGEIYQVPAGESAITVTVTSFDGTSSSYNVYLLNGNDSGTFSESTLVNFPDSYYSGLWLMHTLEPGYIFTAYNTGLDYQTVLTNECSEGRSLLQYSSFPDCIRENSKVYDSPDWMACKPEVVSYYLDPRNFLVPDRVFMFEKLSFDPDVQTPDGVKSIIKGSFMDTSAYDYATAIYNAGQTAGVSPYLLASRIIQEMGYSGQSALATGTVEGYEGFYNFYNIGSTATTDDGGAVVNGARYAQWGRDYEGQEITDEEAALMLPWNSIEKAITGGALWIASGYIDAGQDTLYFQKFDVKSDSTDLYSHQYAQNVMMAYSESLRYYNSYNDIGMIGQEFEFDIPVYNNMPEVYGYLP